MCIEREKDNFKSREVNCLKECALALMTYESALTFDVVLERKRKRSNSVL